MLNYFIYDLRTDLSLSTLNVFERISKLLVNIQLFIILDPAYNVEDDYIKLVII